MIMQAGTILTAMAESADKELTGNILPFWINNAADNRSGGFYGRISGLGETEKDAPRGAILNARILWSFAAAYRHYADSSYMGYATRARDYILEKFFDNEYGGTYWLLDSDGTPRETKKQIYSQAFFIYALSEYYMAAGDETCKNKAVELFRLIEQYSFDNNLNGYLEAFDRQWGYLEDLRLSEKDANEKKTMNTHLHLLEAYTNLCRIWPEGELREKLTNLVNLFIEKIIDPDNGHLILFFDEYWNRRSSIISFGHDIETSWLLYEAAEVTGNRGLIKTVRDISVHMARTVLEGIEHDGSLIYESDSFTGHADRDRHWWVQAEAVVGFINAWQLTGEDMFLNHAVRVFDYIQSRLTDRQHGEWFWSIRADGTVNTVDDKAGFWKCPYHNSRMCLEIIQRSLQEKK